jgi:diguanylate cyclase (GGDEF)-like protein
MVAPEAVVVLAIVDAVLVALFFLFRVLPWAQPGPWRLIWIIASLTAALFTLGEMAAILIGGNAVAFEVQLPLFGAILAMTTCFILAYLHGQRISEHAISLAMTDELTGLPNFRAFTAGLDKLLLRRDAFSVAYIHLDGLPDVNELYGPLRVDSFLKTFANVLRESVRSSDVVGRLGGAQFALLLLGADMERAREITDRVLAALQQLVIRDLGATDVAASIGIVPRGAESNARQLLRLADKTMHEAKRSGANRVALAGQTTR